MQLAPLTSSAQAVLPYLPSSASISTETLSAQSDSSGVFLGTLPKGLTITAQEIIAKINAQLKAKLPAGVESLKPEEVTPEATANTIVSGIASLFDAFAKQNPELAPEELLNRFMEQARSGVERGYNEAFKFLDDAGAFSLDGIKAGVEKTKGLIADKLAAFEAQKRVDLGIDKVDQEQISDSVKTTLLGSTGKTISVIA